MTPLGPLSPGATGMRWRSGIAIMLLALLLATPVLAHVSEAASVYLTYALVNNTIIVQTLHYRLVLDANKGGIVEMNLTNDFGEEYVILNNVTIPLLSLIVNGDVLRNGVISVIGESKDMQLLIKVTYNTSYGNVTQKITFYSWTPEIQVEVAAENPVPNMTIVLIASIYPSVNETVKRVYTYAEKENITSKIITVDGVHQVVEGEIPISIATIGLVQIGNETGPSNISFFQGIALIGGDLPAKLVTKSRFEESGLACYREELSFTNFTSTVISFLVTNYVPSVLALPPFAVPLSAVADLDNNLDIIARLNKYIQNLKDQIDTLNNTINTLTDRLEQLQKELDAYKGCEDHYKQEIAARDYQIQRLQERLNTTGMIEIAVFIVGIVLGIVAGRYILSK